MPKRKKELAIYTIKDSDTVLGIDYSLSKFGYALIDASGELLSSGRFDNKIYAKDRASSILDCNKHTLDSYRMYNIASKLIQDIVFPNSPTFCIFEGSSMNSLGAAKTILSENLGAIKALLASYFSFENNIPCICNVKGYEKRIPILEEVAPTSVKKFATGDGRSEKKELNFYFNMLTELDINDDDISDAYWIAQTFLWTRTTKKDC